MPDLSIIVPVYNKEKYLIRCLESIVNQLFEDYEVLVIDDGSTDRSGEICDAFSKRYEKLKVIHQKNSGVSTARNKALDLAKGEYVSFVDADDFVDQLMYVKMIASARKNDADLVVCGNNYYNEDMEYLWSGQIGNHIYEGEEVYKTLYSTPNPIGGGCCNKLFRLGNAKVRYNESIKIGEDWLFLFDFYHNCKKAVHISDCLYNVIQSSGSATRNDDSNNLMLTLQSSKLMLNKASLISKEIANMAVDKYLDDCMRYGAQLNAFDKKHKRAIKNEMFIEIIKAYLFNKLSKEKKHKYIVGMLQL